MLEESKEKAASTVLQYGERLPISRLLFLAQFLEARIIPQRVTDR
jgi:hypothetical protein